MSVRPELVYLICSGGSASKVLPIPDDVPVGCVNGSYKIIEPRIPTWYCVGELKAALEYRDVAKRFNEAGCINLGRERCISRGLHGGRPIDYLYGPGCLQHWHTDVHGPLPEQPKDHIRPANTRPWITSGVLLFWWILGEIKPKKIIVAGLDGYPPNTSKALEYDPKIKGLEGRPARTSDWINQSNWYVGNCIWSLTRYYTDTEIWWAQFPNRFGAAANWRAHWLERGKPKPGTVDATPGVADRDESKEPPRPV